MKTQVISTHTKTWTIGYQFSSKDPAVGTVMADSYAIISHEGREPREYRVSPHADCPDNGLIYVIQAEWSDNAHCTNCDYFKYYSIGD